jgi:hypothetical protein
VHNTDLRPLGAGEILDRAVTLYVRRFVVIVSVLAVVIVPLLLIETLVAPGQTRIFADLAGMVQAGGDPGKVREATAAMMRDSRWTGPLMAFNLGAIVVRVLMWNALLAVVASAYRDLRTGLGEAYGRAVRRWLAQLAVGLVYVAFGAIAAVPLLLAYLAVIVAVVGVALARSVALTVGVGTILGLALLVVAVAVMAWLLMAYELAAVAVITETGNPVTAVETALRRAFGRATRWRTVLAGLALLAVIYGGAIPVAAVAAVAGTLAHQPVLTMAITAVGNIVLEGLTAAFVVVFAFDVRVRREGVDLEAALDASESAIA